MCSIYYHHYRALRACETVLLETPKQEARLRGRVCRSLGGFKPRHLHEYLYENMWSIKMWQGGGTFYA